MSLKFHSPRLRRFSRGFTLIELLVTVSVTVIMIGGSIAGFLSFRERQQVINTAKDVQQFMRTAQSKARVRDTPFDCDDSNMRLQGYRVNFQTPLTMVPLCGPDSSLPGTATPKSVVETLTIDPTISTDIQPHITTFDFYTLHRGTNLSGTTTILFTSNGTTFSFTIDPGGAISNVQ